MFSATISSQVKDFALSGIKEYKMIQVDKESKISDDLKIHFFIVRNGEKGATLLYLIKEVIEGKLDQNGKQEQAIIFAATRHHVEYLNMLFTYSGLKCAFIYGNMDQKTREERLFQFRVKKVNFLIVTDLAARGLDIPLLANVIHFDFPSKMKLFIHRSGRTARAGQKGTAFVIISIDELPYLHDLSVFVGRKYQDQVDSMNEEERKNFIANPNKISYGKFPQSLLDEYCSAVSLLHENNPTVLDPLKQSMTLSLQKYNKTKDPASHVAISSIKPLQQ